MKGIYKLTSPSGKSYIGQSINIEKRLRDYKNLSNCKRQTKLLNALKKYGFDLFKIEILFQDENCTVDLLNEKEIEFIKQFNTIEGYNCLSSGRNYWGYKLSEKACKNISKGRKGIKHKVGMTEERKRHLSQTIKGENNPFYGNSMFTGGANPSAIKVLDKTTNYLYSCKKEMYEKCKTNESYRTFVRKLNVLHKKNLVEFIYPEHYKKYYEKN